MKKKTVRRVALAASALAVAGGVAAFLLSRRKTIPEGVEAVTPFDLDRYLGKWYEIARFDYRFEKGLDHATAKYSRNADGSIKVVNKGRKSSGKKVKAVGRAVLAGPENAGMLKVSFFGPFYAGYNVIAIDPQYQHALVAGQNRDYLWILSREKKLPDEVREAYLQKARDLGFAVEKLVWPEQGESVETAAEGLEPTEIKL